MQPTPLLQRTPLPAPDAEDLGWVGTGLRRRLLALLITPLFLLAVLNAAFDYRVAGGAALQQDAQLQRLAPLLADSLVSWRETPDNTDIPSPVLLMAPPVEEFLKDRASLAGYRISDAQGRHIAGDEWLDPVMPRTFEPEFSSMQVAGVTFRIVSLRVNSRVGEVVAQLADGSDARQQWWRSVVFKVLVPNFILMVLAFFVVRWAVARALAPLIELTHAVQHRSPADLHPIDAQRTPLEVRPLVEAINQLLVQLDAQVNSQKRFVADAAHQLRTPLAGLQSQVEAWAQHAARPAQTGPADDQADTVCLTRTQVHKLRDATRRTTQLANQLLALSRVDAQTTSRDPMAVIDLRHLCEEILHTHLDAATVRQIDLGLDCQDAHATGHEWLLREALANLVNNAIKYTPVNGTVTVRCAMQQDPAGAWLEVEDNGPGIVPAERARVVERFYRSPGASTEGNGLGLAIVAEIARLHGGELRLGDARASTQPTAFHAPRAGLCARLILPVRQSPTVVEPASHHV